MSASYGEQLLELARADERVIVMTAENRAPIRALPPQLGARFVDTGITEQTMVGMAAGLALRGRIPVVHALATFLTMRAFEFIRTDVGLPALPVKIVGTVPGILSEANGPTHQALEDVALLRGVPNVCVFCPADADDLVAALPAIVADPSPWYIRHCERPAPAGVRHEPFSIGRAEVFAQSEGDDVALIVLGALFRETWEAAALLRAQGISVRVINVRCADPFDARAIVAAASECTLLVTVEDHFATGGLYSLVCETLVRNGVAAPLASVSCGDEWFTPALLEDAIMASGFSPSAIAARVCTALAARSTATAL